MDLDNDIKNESEDSYSKKEFDSFVKNALEQMKDISLKYKEIFEGSEGKESKIKEIEDYLTNLKTTHDNLFSVDETGNSKISQLNKNLEEIKQFHTELLEGGSSIESDIKDSQDKITEFYIYLFGGENTEGQDKNIKKAIENILNFNSDLSKEDGYQKTIEDAHKQIIEAYEDLYTEDENGQNKITIIKKHIEDINNFNANLSEEIIPFIKDTKNDIVAKQKDVALLLDRATGGSLVEGFLRSKNEYQQRPEYREMEGSIFRIISIILINIFIFFRSLFVITLDYFLFIFPLLLSVFIFIKPDMVAQIVGNTNTENNLSNFLGGLNFYGRLIISLPLWWISWFGQRSISQKRRLAEEYNHKAQVTTMYLKFVSKETEGSYPLEIDSRQKLHRVLIKVIERHPGNIFGKDETMLDKIIDLVYASRGSSRKDEDKKEASSTDEE